MSEVQWKRVELTRISTNSYAAVFMNDECRASGEIIVGEPDEDEVPVADIAKQLRSEAACDVVIHMPAGSVPEKVNFLHGKKPWISPKEKQTMTNKLSPAEQANEEFFTAQLERARGLLLRGTQGEDVSAPLLQIVSYAFDRKDAIRLMKEIGWTAKLTSKKAAIAAMREMVAGLAAPAPKEDVEAPTSVQAMLRMALYLLENPNPVGQDFIVTRALVDGTCAAIRSELEGKEPAKDNPLFVLRNTVRDAIEAAIMDGVAPDTVEEVVRSVMATGDYAPTAPTVPGRIFRVFTKTDRWSKDGHPSEGYSDDEGKTWRWVSNDSVIALDICRDYGVPCDVAAQTLAYQAYVNEACEQYRANQPETPSAEEQAEARAAFGPGVEVSDVISGRKYTT